MLRLTSRCLHVTSTVRTKIGSPWKGKGFGRNLNPQYVKYSGRGWGISMPPLGKDRVMRIQQPDWIPAPNFSGDPDASASKVAKTLSPHWRPFALRDGGVLFTHPSHSQVMRWNAKVLQRENEATGMTSADHHTHAKIQDIVAGSTLEHMSLAHWRRGHIKHVFQTKGAVIDYHDVLAKGRRRPTYSLDR